MTETPATAPLGTATTEGIVHRLSPFSVTDTVERLTRAIDEAGAKVFVVIDHSGEAEGAGMSLRDTKLVIFGSPAAGTPIMDFAPLAALDLPLKVLVWQDDAGTVWMTYLSAAWLVTRHGIPVEVAKPLSAAENMAGRIGADSGTR